MFAKEPLGQDRVATGYRCPDLTDRALWNPFDAFPNSLRYFSEYDDHCARGRLGRGFPNETLEGNRARPPDLGRVLRARTPARLAARHAASKR